jgi:hypothetical protein
MVDGTQHRALGREECSRRGEGVDSDGATAEAGLGWGCWGHVCEPAAQAATRRKGWAWAIPAPQHHHKKTQNRFSAPAPRQVSP